MPSQLRVVQRKRLAFALLGAGIVVVLVGAWLLRSTPTTKEQAVGFSDPGLIHVHGLGVDAADGGVYAATHSGLFRLPDGSSGPAVRVADRWQDTMAFTVVGPNQFIASGHPDLREDKTGPARPD
jgi:hypothetical protein